MKKRKLLFIDKEFQIEFILKNLKPMFISLVIIIALIFTWQKMRIKQGALLNLPANVQMIEWAEKNGVATDSAEFYQQFIVQAKAYTLFDLTWQPVAIAFVLNVIAVFIGNFFYSHRIIEPILKLKRILKDELEGKEFKPIEFRKNDYFHDLADLANKVLYRDKGGRRNYETRT